MVDIKLVAVHNYSKVGNELCCGFGCVMNRTTLNAVCHTYFIKLLGVQTSSILQQLYFPRLWELCQT